jgi:tetratricopeptide (TPR) repeat protein
LTQHYTRAEVARILGLSERRLRYWERLRLVAPRPRWGHRFYTFRDLVALKTVAQLTASKVPARRLRQALLALQKQLGGVHARLSELRVVSNGREVAVFAPRSRHALEPLTGQFVMNFDTRELAGKVQVMASRTAEEWFELGLASDSSPDTWPQAAEAYAQALSLAPDWTEAQINLGATLYQLGHMEEAEKHFLGALTREPQNSTIHFNLGCVLDELGRYDQAILHLRRAVELSPRHADAHFNLALAYEKNGERRPARQHWAHYLRLEPRGAWADYARARLAEPPSARPAASSPFAVS